jgi:hypothetical protein
MELLQHGRLMAEFCDDRHEPAFSFYNNKGGGQFIKQIPAAYRMP